MRYGCEGLVAVISGGTSGIGLAAAAMLVRDQARVFILGRDIRRGDQAARQLQKDGGTAAYISTDVTDAASCKQAVEQIAQQYGNIDILINSAGIYKEERLENFSMESFNSIMSVNVAGTMLLTQAALPYMYGGGSIVNIASDAGISGNYGCALYCASKGAVVALTKALALDLAPKIRVNCVCPADVQTPLLDKQLQECGGSYTVEEMAGHYPLQKIGMPEEIAHIICSVASPQNSFMTGSIIAVDGGLTAQ